MTWLLYLLASFACVVGAFFVGMAVRNFVRGRQCGRWPQAIGTVIRSYVRVDPGDDGGKGHIPEVEYEYTIDGDRFRGTRIRYGQTGSWTRRQAERTISGFASGAQVAVFVNPKNPREAVLKQGCSLGNLWIVSAGLAFFAAGVALVVKAKIVL